MVTGAEVIDAITSTDSICSLFQLWLHDRLSCSNATECLRCRLLANLCIMTRGSVRASGDMVCGASPCRLASLRVMRYNVCMQVWSAAEEYHAEFAAKEATIAMLTAEAESAVAHAGQD